VFSRAAFANSQGALAYEKESVATVGLKQDLEQFSHLRCLYLFLSIFHPEGTGYQTVWIPYSQGFGGIEGSKGSTARTEVCLYPPMAVC